MSTPFAEFTNVVITLVTDLNTMPRIPATVEFPKIHRPMSMREESLSLGTIFHKDAEKHTVVVWSKVTRLELDCNWSIWNFNGLHLVISLWRDD
jgi:hypothetical protein